MADDFHIDSAFLPDLQRAGLADHDALLGATGDGSLHKRSLAAWRSRIALRAGDQPLYLKRYVRPPIAEQLRQRLRGFGATAAIERHWIARLGELGIDAPRVVAFGARRRGLVEQSSLLLTAAVPGEALERWIPANLDRLLRDRRRRRLLETLARLVRRLHDARLAHRDLYLAHVFVDAGDPAEPRLALIDLQRMIHPRLRWRRWMIKDLAALNYSTPAAAASRTDRVRWYRCYRGSRRLGRGDRRIIRAVAARTRRIARHSAKHGL